MVETGPKEGEDGPTGPEATGGFGMNKRYANTVDPATNRRRKRSGVILSGAERRALAPG
jgi:hypothetical protein